jgi:16S rRNA processing protein RimM
VEVLTDEPARFEPGAIVFLEGTSDRLTIAESGTDGPGLLVRFRERTDRTSVEDLRDRYLEAPAPSEALPEGSFYWHQVVGIAAQDVAGADLGHVVDVFRAGGGEVFVVRGPRGELMVPAVSGVVRELAPMEGRLVVDTDALGLDDAEPRPKVRGRRTTRARKAAARGEGIATASGAEPSPDGEPPQGSAHTEPDGGSAPTEPDGGSGPTGGGSARTGG